VLYFHSTEHFPKPGAVSGFVRAGLLTANIMLWLPFHRALSSPPLTLRVYETMAVELLVSQALLCLL
jgi:hypothetical protein